MTTSLLKLANNLMIEIHKINCEDYDYLFEYESVKDDLIK